MGRSPFVVVCIPAYNEERTIGGVVVRTIKYVDGIVVCDDGFIVDCLVHYPYIGGFFGTG